MLVEGKMMVKSKRKKQFDFVGKMALSMMGGFLTSYIALDLLSDEPRKLSSNTFIGICTIFWNLNDVLHLEEYTYVSGGT